MKLLPALSLFSLCLNLGFTSLQAQSFETLADDLLKAVTVAPGEKIDTAMVRGLFHPKAIISVLNPNDGHLESVQLNAFLEFLTDPSYEEGFKEWELRKTVHHFEGIATIWQAFRGQAAAGQEVQGINSYQFVYSDGRWWIMSLVWTFDSGNGLESAFEAKG
jgi:hypothetical protein